MDLKKSLGIGLFGLCLGAVGVIGTIPLYNKAKRIEDNIPARYFEVKKEISSMVELYSLEILSNSDSSEILEKYNNLSRELAIYDSVSIESKINRMEIYYETAEGLRFSTLLMGSILLALGVRSSLHYTSPALFDDLWEPYNSRR